MKKKWWWLIVILVVIIIGIIGGKMFMNNKDSEDKDVKKELAIYIVQNYEDVEKIQFGKITENKMTGSSTVSAKLNENNIITFTLEDINSINKNTMSIYYDPSSFELKHKVNKENNLNDIEVQFEGGFK